MTSTGLSAQEISRFKQAFVQMDTDKDGYVAGSDCFPVFMRSGLDKGILKHIWDLVAGNEGKLNEEQFLLSQHYIMLSLKGGQIPARRPTTVPVPTIVNQQGSAPFQGVPQTQTTSMPQQQSNQFETNQFQMPPAFPAAQAMVGQQQQQQQSNQYQMPGALPAPVAVNPITSNFQYVQGTPMTAAQINLSQVSTHERRKLEEAQEKARKADEERQKAVLELQVAQQNKDLYRNAMQELVTFKSRADAELVQLSAQSRIASTEMENCKSQYEEYKSQYEELAKKHGEQKESLVEMTETKERLLSEIQGFMEQQAMPENDDEVQNQLLAGQQEIIQLQSQLNQLKQEHFLMMQKRKQEAEKAQLEKEQLETEISELTKEIESSRMGTNANQELENLRGSVSKLTQEAEIERKGLEQALATCGELFETLSQAALKTGVEIPVFKELKLEWSERLAVHAADFPLADAGEGEAFTLVSNLSQIAQTADADGTSFRSEMPVKVEESAEEGPGKSGSDFGTGDMFGENGQTNSNAQSNRSIESNQSNQSNQSNGEKDWFSFES